MLDPEVRKRCWTPQSSKEEEEEKEEGEKRVTEEDNEGFCWTRSSRTHCRISRDMNSSQDTMETFCSDGFSTIPVKVLLTAAQDEPQRFGPRWSEFMQFESRRQEKLTTVLLSPV